MLSLFVLFNAGHIWMSWTQQKHKLNETDQLDKLEACLNDMKTWMQVARYCLGLNVSDQDGGGVWWPQHQESEKSDLISTLFCVIQLFVYFVLYFILFFYRCCFCDWCNFCYTEGSLVHVRCQLLIRDYATQKGTVVFCANFIEQHKCVEHKPSEK